MGKKPVKKVVKKVVKKPVVKKPVKKVVKKVVKKASAGGKTNIGASAQSFTGKFFTTENWAVQAFTILKDLPGSSARDATTGKKIREALSSFGSPSLSLYLCAASE